MARVSLAHRIANRASLCWTILARSSTPGPLLRDSFGRAPADYTARSRDGLACDIRAGRSEWLAFLENVLRGYYFRHGCRPAPGATVVDVGANIGTYTVAAARAVGPHGRVVSFEPDTGAFAQLERNIRLNGLTNVRPVRAAVAAKAGTVRFTVSPNSQFSSMYGQVGAHRVEGRTVEARAVTLEEALTEAGLERCDVLKLDCEGAEHEILDALSPENADRIGMIAMEGHPLGDRGIEDLARRLRELGFADVVCDPHDLVYARRAPREGSTRPR